MAIVSFHELPGWPIFVAANRDEVYDRPSAPPRLERDAGVTCLAPRDLRAGGTWIGVNEQNVFAVITNRSDLREIPPPTARSRGLLVLDTLRAGEFEAALEVVERSRAFPSAAFNLVVGNHRHLALVERVGGDLGITQIDHGPVVVSNRGAANDASVGEVRRALSLWKAWPRSEVSPWEAAREILTTHEPSGDLPPLLKRQEHRGTVASTIFGLRETGELEFRHAHGPPDEVPYETYRFR